MARRSKEDAEKTCLALLDAALQLFSQQGIAKTTLQQVATAAGLTRGAVYWHFKDKDAMVIALWNRHAQHLHQAFIEDLNALPENVGWEIVHATIRQHFGFFVEDDALFHTLRLVMLGIERTDEETVLTRFMDQRREEFFVALLRVMQCIEASGQLRQGLSAEIANMSLWAYMTGLLNTHLDIDKSIMNIQDHIDELVNIWFLGMQSGLDTKVDN